MDNQVYSKDEPSICYTTIIFLIPVCVCVIMHQNKEQTIGCPVEFLFDYWLEESCLGKAVLSGYNNSVKKSLTFKFQ